MFISILHEFYLMTTILRVFYEINGGIMIIINTQKTPADNIENYEKIAFVLYSLVENQREFFEREK